MSLHLRAYQEDCINAIFQYFSDRQSSAPDREKNPVVAMPTGTGKSLTIGGFCHRVLRSYPNERFMMLTHVKELIKQNADTMRRLWPQAPLGIFSAGLGQRDTMFPITFGGVASVVNFLDLFGVLDFLLIDEAHLVSLNDAAIYRRIIQHFKRLNSKLRVIGFTATPFRMGQGYITDGGIFTDICYDLTGIEAFNKLIYDGYLSPLIPRATTLELDVSGVELMQGEYNLQQLDAKVNKQKITIAACNEMHQYGWQRRAWLIFCTGISHAENTAAILKSMGIRAAAIHNKLSSDERGKTLQAFRDGKLTAITNFNILTTGFDVPHIDLIGMLRPTKSTPLWVQMLGRGTRPADGKQNCLVLDYARNTLALGPINDPVIPKKKGETSGEAPVKICEQCGVYNHSSTRFCINCGAEFQFRIKIDKQAATLSLIRDMEQLTPKTEWFNVKDVQYIKKVGKRGLPMLLVTYICGLNRFTEYQLFEHSGLPKHHAHDWWKQVHNLEPPATVDQALSVIAELRKPKRIRVWVNNDNGRSPKVMNYEY